MSKIVSLKRDGEKQGLEPRCMPDSIYYIMYSVFIVSLFGKTVRQEAWEKESKPFADLNNGISFLQKGGVPAAPSGTATLLRLSPNHRFHPRPILAVTDFRRPRLSWLDGRCVQGPGTYSPRHG